MEIWDTADTYLKIISQLQLGIINIVDNHFMVRAKRLDCEWVLIIGVGKKILTADLVAIDPFQKCLGDMVKVLSNFRPLNGFPFFHQAFFSFSNKNDLRSCALMVMNFFLNKMKIISDEDLRSLMSTHQHPLYNGNSVRTLAGGLPSLSRTGR
ncbi:MAG: hypothetical protein ABIE68_00590 [bacterium]